MSQKTFTTSIDDDCSQLRVTLFRILCLRFTQLITVRDKHPIYEKSSLIFLVCFAAHEEYWSHKWFDLNWENSEKLHQKFLSKFNKKNMSQRVSQEKRKEFFFLLSQTAVVPMSKHLIMAWVMWWHLMRMTVNCFTPIGKRVFIGEFF